MDTDTTNLRLLVPESIWLEPEQMEQARVISHQARGETHQWQAYLNALALLGVEQWLHERLPEQSIHREVSEIATAPVLQVGEFKLCLLVTEHVLDELIPAPQTAIDEPKQASHFYVALEVNEEQEEVTIRGFLRYDQLTNYCRRTNLKALNGYYSVPLSYFDPEPNHLLFNCHFLEPVSIPLPDGANSRATVSSVGINDRIHHPLQETTTNLSKWLQGNFDAAWQAIDTLVNPNLALALSTRSSAFNIKRGKLINLGMQLGNQTVALLLIVTPEAENKLAVLVQLHPTGNTRVLPPHIKFCHRSKQGKNLQEVESRSGDNYIQLRSFKGEPGKLFSIEVCLGQIKVEEHFEL